ncbi:MAG: hypothetical protein ACRCTI_14245, partial [Beijerinckiaceae bacterium]
MLFSLDTDFGDTVTFYIVPDNFSATPSARISSGDQVVLEIEADGVIDALVLAGRHSTGRCGFTLTNDILPNLGSLDDLAIEDVETGILVYRRLR